MKKLLCLCLLAYFTTSCASLTKKMCETTNWHQHGYNLAMNGKRPSGDNTVEQCKKVETISEGELDRGFKQGMWDYCKPEIVMTKGKEGEFFNFDFCDPGHMGMLKEKHMSGVKMYCATDNGYSAGAKGKSYNNICPKESEKNFIKEFNRGRKSYLTAKAIENRKIVDDLDKRNTELTRQLELTRMQLSYLPPPQIVRERTLNPVTNQWEEKTHTEDPNQSTRSSLESRIYQTNKELNENQKRQDAMKKDMYQWESEASTLSLN